MPLEPICVVCQAPLAAEDRHCPACGQPPATGRALTRPAIAALLPIRAAVPGLVQGMALAGAGLALRYAVRKAPGFVLRRMVGSRRSPRTAQYYSETRIIRRVWTR